MTTSSQHAAKQSIDGAIPLEHSANKHTLATGNAQSKPYIPKPRSRLRSTGCKTCRQRKIKCDEQKPVCKNCTKSHRNCLGYNSLNSYPFVVEDSERHDRQTNEQARALSYDSNQPFFGDIATSRRESTLSANSDEQALAFEHMMYESAHPASYDRVQHRSGRSQSMDGHAPAPLLMSPQQATEQHLETFFFRRFITSVWLHSQVDAWQFYLPLALRNSPSLYYSVMSLSALYMSKMETQARAREYALDLYQGTLGQLQKAIYDPTKALRDETIMATIIVGLYELIDKPDLLSWTSHSRGTSELMKMRGTQAVRAGMGKMLFLTFRGYEVVRAILQFEETFVADPMWTNESSSGQTIRASQGMLTASAETKDSPMQTGPDYAAVLFMLGGQVANLQATCVRHSRHPGSSPRTQDSLLERARMLEQQLKLWRASLPSSYNARDFTPPLDLAGYTIGYQLCFYSAFLILIHRLVAKYLFRDLSSVHPECDALARYILVTTQYLTLTFTSVNLNVTWPLYMASIALLRQEEKQQAIESLRSISRDKGWRVADSALSAASLAAHKSRLRDAAGETGLSDAFDMTGR